KPQDLLPEGAESVEQGAGAELFLKIDYTQRILTTQELEQAGGTSIDIEAGGETGFGPLAPTTQSSGLPNRPPTNAPHPRITIEILNQAENSLIPPNQANGLQLTSLP